MLGFLHRPPERPPAPLRLALVESIAPTCPLDNPMITSAEEYEALSLPAADLVANGRVGKFLVDLRDPATPDVHFVNGNYTEGGVTPDSAKYHYYFAQAVLGIREGLDEFNRVTYFSPTKRYAAGVVHTYLLSGTTDPVYGIQLYPQDIAAEQGIVQIVRAVLPKITIPGARLAFVRTGSQQTTANSVGDLHALGVEVLTLDQLLGEINYVPLNPGEAWGHLRIFPGRDQGLTAADIPVFDELPLDLSVVAGVITRAVQDASSHVNLKSKERKTPNMVLRDAGPDQPRLQPFRDQPVHLVVGAEDFTIEPSTEAEVAAQIADRGKLPWIPLESEVETRVLSFDELAAGSPAEALTAARRFGTKAANLGFLRHRDVLGTTGDAGAPSADHGYDLAPAGFGVPFEFYRRFLAHEPNGTLRTALTDLISAEKAGGVTPDDRVRRSRDIQALFLAAQLPSDDLAAVRAKITEALPGINKIKIRSSANAEDVPNFDGAGLHDSFAATVSKHDDPDGGCRFDLDPDDVAGAVKRDVKPKTVACAIKGVYASLWNVRAIEERTYARIDHATVAMGLAVVAEYDTESEVSANAVVVTRVINAKGVYGYTLSIQAGNNLVTNPDPGTHSEITIAALGVGDEPTSFTTTRYALPTAGAAERADNVLARDQMIDIVGVVATVEQAYCIAKPTYYEGSCRYVVIDDEKPTSLDLELKILENGHLVCKQVREFGGR